MFLLPRYPVFTLGLLVVLAFGQLLAPAPTHSVTGTFPNFALSEVIPLDETSELGWRRPSPQPQPKARAIAKRERHYRGIASWYGGTRSWKGSPHLALAGFLGGRYSGKVNGRVTVCATRCHLFVAVDYCQCYAGTADERIVDLSPEAWALISDLPLSRGLLPVRITIWAKGG